MIKLTSDFLRRQDKISHANRLARIEWHLLELRGSPALNEGYTPTVFDGEQTSGAVGTSTRQNDSNRP